ncbi:MAG TPA: hypothetical protein PLN18_01150 [Candidatus Colwellbacteria bacterium]|nr:hypothetical protein [Candidatus Colwellbacteria bacterium]HQA95961.1 hypothetical protein [Candidatus Colwellbacteria bacterium]
MKRLFFICLVIAICYPALVLAIIKTNNPNFNGNANGWTLANGSGTNTCGNTLSASEINFNSFAYSGTLGGQTAFRANGTSVILTINYRGMIHQPLTIPGTGNVNVRGSFSYYGDEVPLLGILGSNASWIRLDLYNSSNTDFVANLGCVTLSDDVPWTTTSPVNVNVPAGDYTIRATLRTSITGGLLLRTVTLGIDNINVNVAPSLLTLTQPATNVELGWTASTPGTGAPGLHATQPYEIARKTSSGLTTSDIIATSGTNSYADSTALPNTTYWYAIFDKDVNNNRSPISNEMSILTKPGVPQNVQVNAVDEESMEIDWDAPNEGAASYKIQRAPDESGSPGTYADLKSGIVDTVYIDDGHACGDTYWYRVIAVNSSGESTPSSGVKGNTLYCISIVLNTDGSVDFGFMALESTKDSTPSGINDPETVTALNGAVDLDVKSTNFTDGINSWSFGNGPGDKQTKFEFSNNGNNWTTFLVPQQYYMFKENVAKDATASIFLRLTTPLSSDSLGPYNSNITIQASRP